MNISCKTGARRSFLAAAAGLAVSLTVGGHTAQGQTIGQIKHKGEITFGIVSDQVPFGFMNEKGELDGYDIELTRMMAKELGVRPRYQTITSGNRSPSC